MLYLKEINRADAEKEYRFFQEVPSDRGYENRFYGVTYEAFTEAIPRYLDAARGIGLEEGHVPDTCFLLWEDGEILGIFKVRHYLNETLRNGAGHIGYAIHPKYRGQGYGTRGLALALQELAKLPDFEGEEAYLCCARSNPASLRVMLKNGGCIHHQDENRYYVRIKVEKQP